MGFHCLKYSVLVLARRNQNRERNKMTHLERNTYIKNFIEVLNKTVENNHVDHLYKILSEIMTKEEWTRWEDCREF